METFSALLALSAGNSLVTGEFPAQRPVTRSFDVFFDRGLNKRLSKQSWDWWLRRHRVHYDATEMHSHGKSVDMFSPSILRINIGAGNDLLPSDNKQAVTWTNVNTLRPGQNGRRFADDTFRRMFLNENVRISIKISLKFVPKGPINNIPALIEIMAWRR